MPPAGWSLRAEEYGAEGMLAALDGTYLAFPVNAEECRAAGDPRPAVLERHPSQEAYLSRYAEQVAKLHQEGFLFGDDAVHLLREASERKLGRK